MPDYIITRVSSDELYHHGVKGQKHGVRQYQNPDGSLTPEGRDHYGVGKGRYGGMGGQGYEARQAYKRGEISKAEKKEAMRAKGMIGKIDNVLSLGFGRRMREFQNRHRKGYVAASAALGIAGTLAVGALTGGSAAAIMAAGQSAVGSIIGTAVRTHVTNPLILKYGYNSTLKEANRDLQKSAGQYAKKYANG